MCSRNPTSPLRIKPESHPDPEACSRLKKRSTSADYLVQRGWLKPLTMDGRKVDMRMYLMIANHDPYYVFTRFGEVRRSRLKFNPDDVSDPAMHM